MHRFLTLRHNPKAHSVQGSSQDFLDAAGILLGTNYLAYEYAKGKVIAFLYMKSDYYMSGSGYFESNSVILAEFELGAVQASILHLYLRSLLLHQTPSVRFALRISLHDSFEFVIEICVSTNTL